jgi:hypothetical protein
MALINLFTLPKEQKRRDRLAPAGIRHADYARL